MCHLFLPSAAAAAAFLSLHFGPGTIVWALVQPANHVGLQQEKGRERKPPLWVCRLASDPRPGTRVNAGYYGYPAFPTAPMGELYTQRVEAIPTQRLAMTETPKCNG